MGGPGVCRHSKGANIEVVPGGARCDSVRTPAATAAVVVAYDAASSWAPGGCTVVPTGVEAASDRGVIAVDAGRPCVLPWALG